MREKGFRNILGNNEREGGGREERKQGKRKLEKLSIGLWGYYKTKLGKENCVK